MNVAFMHDDPGYMGGAELSTLLLMDSCPHDVVSEAPDMLVINNAASFGPDIIPTITAQPFVFYSHDAGHNLHPSVREVLLSQAQRVVFASPDAQRIYTYAVTAPVEIIPPAMDLAPFRAAASRVRERVGTCYLGTVHPFKGVGDIIAWARDRQTHVDFWGPGDMPDEDYCRFRGPVDYSEVPDLLAGYQRFIFFPRVYEPFARTIPEAQAAGCEVLTNDRAGVLWWMRERPDDLERGAEMFWEMVDSLTPADN